MPVLPPNNDEYFRDSPQLGVIPAGTIIKIKDNPHGIDREFATQFWVKVEVME